MSRLIIWGMTAIITLIAVAWAAVPSRNLASPPVGVAISAPASVNPFDLMVAAHDLPATSQAGLY
jgi:hypothetical protein